MQPGNMVESAPENDPFIQTRDWVQTQDFMSRPDIRSGGAQGLGSRERIETISDTVLSSVGGHGSAQVSGRAY